MVYAPADVTDAEVAAAVHSANVSRLRWIKGLYESWEFCREPRQFLGNCVIKKLMANSIPEYEKFFCQPKTVILCFQCS